MSGQDVAVIVMLLPMILMTILSIRILIRSDHNERSLKLDHIPVTIEEQRRKKDRQ